MRNKPYKRRPGDYEIRILTDGRVIMIGPDDDMMEVARAIDPQNNTLSSVKENQAHVRADSAED